MSVARTLRQMPAVAVIPAHSVDFSGKALRDDDQLIVGKIQEFSYLPKSVPVDINLGSNYFNLIVAQYLATWLKSGYAPTRTTLRLDANEFNDDAVKLLAEAAVAPLAPTDLEIILDTNNITDVGARHLAGAFYQLQDEERKLKVSLQANHITAEGATLLQAAVCSKPFITIDLKGNDLSPKGKDAGESLAPAPRAAFGLSV